MVCIVTAQILDVTVATGSITAVPGDSATLRVKFTVNGRTPASCEGVGIDWSRKSFFGFWLTIWAVDSLFQQNTARNGYATYLTGSSVSLATLNLDGHAITFKNITERDAGQYRCTVECFTQNSWLQEDSPDIAVTVNGKYISVLWLIHILCYSLGSATEYYENNKNEKKNVTGGCEVLKIHQISMT